MPMKKTNRILAVVLVLGLGISLPLVSLGASNDVTLTTDTVISVGGYSLNVSGSSAVVESITVNASSFSFVLLSGSSINVTSADGRILTTDADGKYIVSNSCSASGSYVLKHSGTAESATINVAPSSSACPSDTASGNSSGSSSGRGGGGGSSVAPSPSPSLTAVAVVATTPAVGKAVFMRGLSVGSKGDDVRNLQTRLLNEGFFKGSITGYFGPLTQVAVKAYQAKYGIDQLGIVGPATRAQLNKIVTASVNSNAASTSQLTPAQISTIMAQINALLKQVQELQAQLKALGN